MDPPEPPECSQCGKEIIEEPDLNCEICFATLCSDPDCDSKHTEENHPFRGIKAFITEAADPQGTPLTREAIDESMACLKENRGHVQWQKEHRMADQDDVIKVSVSASQKINLGNYESADVFFALSNIPSGATPEQIEAALETGELVFKYVKNEVGKQAGIVRLNMEK